MTINIGFWRYILSLATVSRVFPNDLKSGQRIAPLSLTLTKVLKASYGEEMTLKKEVMKMCYNCGCGSPKDDHGKGHMGVDANGKAITDKTFEAAGKAFKMSAEESKKNTHDLLME